MGAAAIPGSGRRVIDSGRRELIRAACAELRPDAVLVDGTFYGDCLDAVPPQSAKTCKVIVTIDVYHQRAASLRLMGAKTVGNDLSRAEETELLNKADLIVALQQEEAAVLQEMAPLRQVVVAPLAAVRLADGGVKEIDGRCLFVGSRCDHNEVSLECSWPRSGPRSLPRIRAQPCTFAAASARSSPDANSPVCASLDWFPTWAWNTVPRNSASCRCARAAAENQDRPGARAKTNRA